MALTACLAGAEVITTEANGTAHSGTPLSVTTKTETTAAYDPLQDLARYNVTWNSPSRNSADSMPIGNGDLGMNVWVESNGDLLLLLSKTDAWSANGRLLKLGRVRINMSPNPFAAGQPFVQTLNIPNGEILITAGSGSDEVSFRIWVDANNPAIYIEAEGDEPRSWQAQLELWRNTPRTVNDGRPREENSFYGVIYDPTAPVVQPDTVVSGLSDRVTWYHRNVHSIWQDTLTVQSLGHLIDSSTDPLLDRTFGGTIYADSGFSNTSDFVLASDTPMAKAKFTIVAQTSITATAADWLAALDKEVAVVEAIAPSERYAAHIRWWKEFWQRHWMVVTESGGGMDSGSDTYAITRGYLLQRFINACGGRGGSPIKFNGSIFTVDATSAYDPDYRKWGPCYWWQNTRFPYWTMPVTGDFDLMQPLFDMYLEALPLARERVRTYYGHAGAYFPETIYFWGTWNNDDYGWDRTGQELGRSVNNYIRWEWQGGIELVAMMLDYVSASGDNGFLTEKLLPFAEEIFDLYDQRYARDENGKLIITPAHALEDVWECTNPAPEIAGMKSVLPRLIALTENADQQAKWTALLDDVPDLPSVVSGTGTCLLAAATGTRRGNGEKAELYCLYPYNLYGVGRPGLALMEETWSQGIKTAPSDDVGWRQNSIFLARMGRIAEAKSRVLARLGPAGVHPDSRFPATWDKNFDWTPDQCNGGVGMITLQQMLMQTDGDRILLFPSWPAEWDLNFKLHAPKQTVIEGRLKDGKITHLSITPIERFGDVESCLGTLSPQAGGVEHERLNTTGAEGGVNDNGVSDP